MLVIIGSIKIVWGSFLSLSLLPVFCILSLNWSEVYVSKDKYVQGLLKSAGNSDICFTQNLKVFIHCMQEAALCASPYFDADLILLCFTLLETGFMCMQKPVASRMGLVSVLFVCFWSFTCPLCFVLILFGVLQTSLNQMDFLYLAVIWLFLYSVTELCSEDTVLHRSTATAELWESGHGTGPHVSCRSWRSKFVI